MYDGKMAQERINDLVRAAEHDRLARSMRRGRRSPARRFASVVTAIIIWPIRLVTGEG